MIKLRENKGILLVSTFLVAAVVTLLSGTYVTSSLVQSRAAQRDKDSLRDFYAAEKGIEYAFVEAQNKTWNWKTHVIGDGSVLNPVNPGAGFATLGNISDPNRPKYNPASGCYEIQTPSGLVQVKAYADPDKSYETWVLSRSGSKIIRFKLTRRSLYKYFYYYPTTQNFDWRNTIDGKNKGGIYVNGDIGLAGMTFTGITEISTPPLSAAAGAIMADKWQYLSPYWLDDRWVFPAEFGGGRSMAPLPQLASPHIFSSSNPYPYNDWREPPRSWPPYDWQSVDRHFADAGIVNGIILPNKAFVLANSWTSWDWAKYTDSGVADEKPVQFYDSNGVLATDAYWAALKTTVLNDPGLCNGSADCANNFFDPAFWNNKTYKRDSNTVPVRYLNTRYQSTDWEAWLKPDGAGASLKPVFNQYSTAIPNIEANYSQLAKTDGLYISGSEMRLNNVPITVLPSWIQDNVQFFNTISPKVVSGSPVKENVLQLDIGASIDSGQIPDNGIIYIAHKNLRLINAAKLPKSLTVVSPYNIYIKGNFNTDNNWKPAAVITNSLVYLLSANFNDPQTLPALSRTSNYPYEMGMIPSGDQDFQSLFGTGKTFAQLFDSWNNETINSVKSQKEDKLNEVCQNYFGLPDNFDIGGNTNLNDFQNNIRQKYYDDRTKNNPQAGAPMPNLAADTTYKVAIASPFEPSGYQLERWIDRDPLTGNWNWNHAALPTVVGAFIQLKNSWVNDPNNNNQPIRDVPYAYQWEGGWYSAWYMRGQVWPMDPRFIGDSWPWYVSRSPKSEYEGKFYDPNSRPSGDFFAGSQAVWQEVAGTDYNFTHHT